MYPDPTWPRGRSTPRSGRKVPAVDQPNFWWRLQSLWGATLAGFGWRRRSTFRMVSYSSEPPLRRLWHVFKPAPPPPQMVRPGPPPWLQPSESELGVAVPLREVLASDTGVVIALIDCVAFSTGFEFAIAVRTKEEIDSHQMGFGIPPASGADESDKQLQIGIQFADGGTAVTGGHPGPEFMAQWKMYAEGREPGSSDGPILAPRSGGGGGKRWDFRYWVWPLPPEGRLTFTCEWPARNLAPTTHDVDATEIRRAGLTSTTLWDET